MKKNRTPYMVIKRVYERLEQKIPRNCTEVIDQTKKNTLDGSSKEL